MSDRSTQTASLPRLTSKQREVLALVADNRTSKEIAATLGISESAVNQRIEMVRAQLGGLPRGELARLYRQERELPTRRKAPFPPTWKKIHLPAPGKNSENDQAESILPHLPDGSQQSHGGEVDGSQLSAFIFPAESGWLSRDDPATAISRWIAMAALIGLGLVLAIVITQFFGAGIPGA